MTPNTHHDSTQKSLALLDTVLTGHQNPDLVDPLTYQRVTYRLSNVYDIPLEPEKGVLGGYRSNLNEMGVEGFLEVMPENLSIIPAMSDALVLNVEQRAGILEVQRKYLAMTTGQMQAEETREFIEELRYKFPELPLGELVCIDGVLQQAGQELITLAGRIAATTRQGESISSGMKKTLGIIGDYKINAKGLLPMAFDQEGIITGINNRIVENGYVEKPTLRAINRQAGKVLRTASDQIITAQNHFLAMEQARQVEALTNFTDASVVTTEALKEALRYHLLAKMVTSRTIEQIMRSLANGGQCNVDAMKILLTDPEIVELS